jgi:hypothetical protein
MGEYYYNIEGKCSSHAPSVSVPGRTQSEPRSAAAWLGRVAERPQSQAATAGEPPYRRVASPADRACDAIPDDRTADAHATADKWRGWILAAQGHGEDWAHTFEVGLDDSERIWAAITATVLAAPVSVVRDRTPHGIVCGVEVMLTINDRTARVATAWHYAHEDAAPRLVTAYPSA